MLTSGCITSCNSHVYLIVCSLHQWKQDNGTISPKRMIIHSSGNKKKNEDIFPSVFLLCIFYKKALNIDKKAHTHITGMPCCLATAVWIIDKGWALRQHVPQQHWAWRAVIYRSHGRLWRTLQGCSRSFMLYVYTSNEDYYCVTPTSTHAPIFPHLQYKKCSCIAHFYSVNPNA